MLDDATGRALSPDRAKTYADRNGFRFVAGATLVE
jgi:hypothetical protein